MADGTVPAPPDQTEEVATRPRPDLATEHFPGDQTEEQLHGDGVGSQDLCDVRLYCEGELESSPSRVTFQAPSSPSGGSIQQEGIGRRLSRSLSRGRHTVTRAVAASLDEMGEEEEDPMSVSPVRSGGRGAALRAGVHSIQNARQEMEDAHINVIPRGEVRVQSTPTTPGGSQLPRRPASRAGDSGPVLLGFFGVFDGHGGRRAAEYAEANLYEAFVRRWRLEPELGARPNSREVWGTEEVGRALRDAYLETEASLLQISKEQEWMDGTTAAVAVILEERHGKRSIVAGNVGDSEVLLGRRGVDGLLEHEVLSEVHNMARNSAEKDRVDAAGGKVYRGRLGHPRFNPRFASLAVSRALGDLFFKDPELTDGLASGLSAEPFVLRRELTKGDCFVILGCDGFFDTVEYREAVEFAFPMLDACADPEDISKALVELAQQKGSTDNITVVFVVLLSGLVASPASGGPQDAPVILAAD